MDKHKKWPTIINSFHKEYTCISLCTKLAVADKHLFIMQNWRKSVGPRKRSNGNGSLVFISKCYHKSVFFIPWSFSSSTRYCLIQGWTFFKIALIWSLISGITKWWPLPTSILHLLLVYNIDLLHFFNFLFIFNLLLCNIIWWDSCYLDYILFLRFPGITSKFNISLI